MIDSIELNFALGQPNQQCLSIIVIDDEVARCDNSLTVTLSSSNPGVIFQLNRQTAIINIRENDCKDPLKL